MATATNKRRPATPAEPARPADEPPQTHWVLRGFDALYRFLASLKLAVLCILTLALVLTGATFFEAAYGIPAGREYFYQNPLFAILLAFLATNIFCAATIRYPWKKRQTGFVVTHIGLLIVLAGAFVSLRSSDEGRLGMVEGTSSRELVRDGFPVIRVQKIDPETDKPTKTYALPFKPGAFGWKSEALAALSRDRTYQFKVIVARLCLASSLLALVGFATYWAVRRPSWIKPVIGSALTSLLIGMTAGIAVYNAMTPSGPRRDVLTDQADPFTFVLTDYLPSSGDRELRAEPDRDGGPAIKVALMATPPGAKAPVDAFGGEGWFGDVDPRFGRTTQTGGAALVSFEVAQGPDSVSLVDDFLHPPANPLKDRVARFHYQDREGRPQAYAWTLDDAQNGKSVTLPGSDFEVKFAGFGEEGLDDGSAQSILQKATGDPQFHLVKFLIRRGGGKESPYSAVAKLPNFPNSRIEEDGRTALRIGYFHPPALTSKGGPMSGRFAQVEILEDDRGKLYYRAFNRDGLVGPPGPIAVGESRPISTSTKMMMSLTLRVDEAIPKARLRRVYVPLDLPRELRDSARPAVQAEMTLDGVTRKLSLMSPVGQFAVTKWETVRFPGGLYRVAYDFDRSPFPFSLALTRFEPGKDPGSGSFATYKSEVELTDAERGLANEKRVISMNDPLTHRRWSFYQSSFEPAPDPATGQEDGAYASFFQVHYDPGWEIIYGGCILVVLGTFLQFYMRAGLFTDGGKLEKQRVEARAARANGTPAPTKAPKARPSREEEPAEDL